MCDVDLFLEKYGMPFRTAQKQMAQGKRLNEWNKIGSKLEAETLNIPQQTSGYFGIEQSNNKLRISQDRLILIKIDMY